MNKETKLYFWTGIGAAALFAVWTALVLTIDVQAIGVRGTSVGLAGLNTWFHRLTGVHMPLYTASDWLGLVPVAVGFFFAGMGLVQWMKRKHLLRVDRDILLLGVYYLAVIACYLGFEQQPIHYRPILIEGRMELSYPSSTTLLVASVMPTLVWQAYRRLKSSAVKRSVFAVSAAFSAAMIIARAVSGVHWIGDIVGSLLLSAALFCLYAAACEGKKSRR